MYLSVDESSADEKDESEQMERVEVVPTEQQRKGPDDQRSDGIEDLAEKNWLGFNFAVFISEGNYNQLETFT